MSKIPPAVVARMATAIEPLDTEARRDRYRIGAYSNSEHTKDVNRRYRWDLLWESKCYSQIPEEGILDSHIDTALRAIVAPL